MKNIHLPPHAFDRRQYTRRESDLRRYLHTSESVSSGHPDKVCDQISDAIVDAYLSLNPFAHVAVETLVTSELVIVAGEVKGAELSPREIENIVRATVQHIG